MHRSPAEVPSESLPRRTFLPTLGGAGFALAILFSMNLLNYIDRYSFFAVATQVKRDLKIDDSWYGYLGGSFMIVYTIISPIMGWLGDRYNRRVLLATGVGIWSVATVGTAFSTDVSHMFFWRALLGVGEASYGVIAPALIADLFPVSKRGRAMGIYYLALPIGTALGFMVAGYVATHWGWRHVFYVVGLPGLVAAFAGLTILDPGRGASEGKSFSPKADRPRMGDYLNLFKTKTFVYNTLGMAAATFATGAYAAWGSTFYQRVRGMSLADANLWIGILLALAGLIGIALSTFVTDLLRKRTRRAYMLLPALTVLASVPLGILGILEPQRTPALAFLFFASILMAMVLGPSNTVTANVVPANQRAAGYALFIFLIHVLGDIGSPILLGWISDLFGSDAIMTSPLGTFLESIGAGPKPDENGLMTNLTVAMLAVGPVLILGGILFLIGSRYLPEDMDRIAAEGGPAPEAGGFGH
ncbi:Hexuronate transporter [Aquisphaera giovannonii]|uniref:Hexuronate transporter n=1 Tax=Aquisphaera giovannonii TaxID=406548 RepID=A0A5B9W153_9BACT|nr:MFS transporter [Aquisphaera giovannonii]QEH34248.1 Hexuronate transporter [Aquisphaera giovannonii]